MGRPPQQAVQPGIPIPAIPADTWKVGVVPGCSQEEEEGWANFPRVGAALEGVFMSCFLGSSRKTTLSHSAALECDELCSSLPSVLLSSSSSGGDFGSGGAYHRAVGPQYWALWEEQREAPLPPSVWAMRPLSQGNHRSQARETGLGRAVPRAGAAAASRFIMALLALGVCLSQASGLVKCGGS